MQVGSTVKATRPPSQISINFNAQNIYMLSKIKRNMYLIHLTHEHAKVL